MNNNMNDNINNNNNNSSSSNSDSGNNNNNGSSNRGVNKNGKGIFFGAGCVVGNKDTDVVYDDDIGKWMRLGEFSRRYGYSGYIIKQLIERGYFIENRDYRKEYSLHIIKYLVNKEEVMKKLPEANQMKLFFKEYKRNKVKDNKDFIMKNLNMKNLNKEKEL